METICMFEDNLHEMSNPVFTKMSSAELAQRRLIQKKKDCLNVNHANMRIGKPLRKHAYSNILRILPPKNENSYEKISVVVFIFLL